MNGDLTYNDFLQRLHELFRIAEKVHVELVLVHHHYNNGHEFGEEPLFLFYQRIFIPLHDKNFHPVNIIE